MGNRSWKMGLDKMFSDTHKHNSAGAQLDILDSKMNLIKYTTFLMRETICGAIGWGKINGVLKLR